MPPLPCPCESIRSTPFLPPNPHPPPLTPAMQALADRLRGLASEVLLSTSRDGTLELSTRVPGLAVSWEVVGLQVLPSSMAVDRSQTGGLAAVAGCVAGEAAAALLGVDEKWGICPS